ncbi:hypothetical protein CY34DRAFT_588271 [Suillus luteus UH-Slu-Lm8-n1]|uniref:Uncharacterized protein n=1 Tax=Suillus luteus UH-Slu-Lm8-n1 TaxID=930992 RepID=A0A0D0AB36_9AGAM|nr:hypothetical protein CY34DRAFT_588271 [Suillus luteus UH-Slu-Lm8-n1]
MNGPTCAWGCEFEVDAMDALSISVYVFAYRGNFAYNKIQPVVKWVHIRLSYEVMYDSLSQARRTIFGKAKIELSIVCDSFRLLSEGMA